MSEQNHSETETRAQLLKKLGSFKSGMLTCGTARFVPMSHNVDSGQMHLWFITASGTEIAEAAAKQVPATYIIASEADNYFLRAEGTCEKVVDSAKLKELWNPVVDSWFEGGIDDPDVRLIRFDLRSAEAWETTGTVGFAYQMIKAKVTGNQPDLGRHIVYTL